MDWSYDLLSELERALLRRVAVFVDGFTYEAAEGVCSDELLSALDVLDLVERLVEAGEADQVRHRHLLYFAEVAANDAKLSHRGSSSDFDDELGNYRVAMTWAADAGHGKATAPWSSTTPSRPAA